MAIVTGTSGNDVLTGTDDADELRGLGGNDVLDGGRGLDTLIGGSGNDTYVIERGTPINPETSLSLFGEPGAWVVQGPHFFSAADGSFNVSAWDNTGDTIPDNLTFSFFGSSDIYFLNLSAHDVGLNLVPGQYDDARLFVPGHPTLQFFGNGMSPGQVFGAFTIHDVEYDYTLGFPVVVTSFLIDFEQHADSPNAPAVRGTVKYNYTDQFEIDSVVELANQGIDTVRSAVNYTLGANLENLVLTGNAQRGTGNGLANVITGNGLGNTLDGAAGADRMIGGAGNDIYIVDDRKDTVVENANEGLDLVRSSVTHTLSANVENLTLTGGARIDGTGNALDNVIVGNGARNKLEGGDGNDTLEGGGGADSLEGGRGNDIYIVDALDDVKEKKNEGTDTVRSGGDYTLGANLENLTLTGAAAVNGAGNELNNVIIGNGAANTLVGGDGNDRLDGQGGADTLRGGRGNDVYIVDQAGDVVSEAGGNGTDTVVSAVTFTLGADFENLTLSGVLAVNGTGNARDNIITGNAAVNILTGGGGDDVLDTGGGADTLRGGAGNDTYVVSQSNVTVTEAANQGVDLVKSSATFTLGANVENLTLTGTFAIDGTGNTLNNVMLGNGAANVLDGRAGADRMSGGAGNDTYVVDSVGDVVTEKAGEGNDSVASSISYTLGNHVENVLLTGTAAINATGNSLNNVMIGNSAANVLRGGAGNDTYGIDGLDTVIENANAGTDTVVSSATHTLGTHFENLVLNFTANINGTGNARDNVLIGNAGNNTLTGGAGNDRLNGLGGTDTLRGGTGDDTYIIDDGNVTNATTRLTLQGQPGAWVVEGAFLFTPSNGGFLVQGGDATRDGLVDQFGVLYTGNNLFDRVTLSAGTNQLGQNLLPGSYTDAERTSFATAGHPGLDLDMNGRGANTVFGNFTVNEILVDYGSATPVIVRYSMDFEFHNDSPLAPPIFGALRYNATAGSVVTDAVVELVNQGTDTVLSGVEYVLTANVENLVLTGTASRGTGNALANVITGNGADNFLDGAGGADRLKGGAGNDIYVVDSTGDLVVENADEGLDRVLSRVTYTLGANVENVMLTGTAAINATGNNLDNGLSGNSAANVLTGGLGNDTYVVDGLDTVVEKVGEGLDTVKAFASYTLGANVEDLTLLGSANLNGTGNGLSNNITGNSGNNVLTGGGDFDFLRGGAGDDTYVVDDVDLVLEEFNHGTDLVRASINYSLTPDVENLTLTGAASISGSGNDLANVITGNSGNNMLDGGTGHDTLIGGQGDDTYIVDGTETGTSVTFSFTGEPGSMFPGPHVFTPATGQIFASGADQDGDGLADTVNVQYFEFPGGANSFFFLTVTSRLMPGTNLQPGLYENAERAFSENFGRPGLDLSGNGTGAGTVFGEFTVNSSAFDYSGPGGLPRIVDFSVDFEFHADFTDAPAVTGSFDYSTTIAPDVVVEQANAGNDTVVSTTSYTLGANLENLQLAGIGAIDGTGNALANVISGNGASNRLTGGGGADRFEYDQPGATDRITDFVRGGGGDILDIADVIAYTQGDPNLADFLQLAANGAGTDLRVDLDGVGGDFITLVTLETVAWSAGLMNEMLAQGNLVVA